MKLCIVQIYSKNENNKYKEVAMKNNIDYFSIKGIGSYGNVLINLLKQIDAIYEYYIIINSNIQIKNFDLCIQKINDNLVKFNPSILSISNKVSNKSIEISPFSERELKVIHSSLINYFFNSDYFNYASFTSYKILEIPFLENLITVNNIDYEIINDLFFNSEKTIDKQRLWCSLYPYINFRYEVKEQFAKIPNKIEEVTSYTQLNNVIKYFISKYKDKQCKKSNKQNFFDLDHIKLFFDLDHNYFRDFIGKPKRSDTLIVLGNGPSLKKEYFDFIKLYDIDTFGLNAAYRFFKEINWYPTYFGCFDYSLTYSHKSNWTEMILDKNIPIKKYFLLDIPSNESYIRNIYPDQGILYFNEEVQKNIKYVGRPHNQDGILWPEYGTLKNKLSCTGVNAIRTGIELGYKNIIMIGHDANYKPPEFFKSVNKEDKHVYKFNKMPNSNPNYFLDNYQQKGDIYCHPGNVLPVWTRFSNLVDDYNNLVSDKVNIYNCSNISAIKEFPNADFYGLIKKLCSKK